MFVDDSAQSQPQERGETESDQNGRRRPPPGPFRDTFESRRGSGQNRLAVEISPEVGGQLEGGRVPPRRFLGEAFQTDGLQVARQPRLEPRRRDRILGDDHQQSFRGAGTLERGTASNDLVEDGTERINIGAGPDLSIFPAGLLGSHVAGRAHHLAGDRLAFFDVQPLGQAEVGDLGRALDVEQDIRRFEVAMHDAGMVGRADGSSQHHEQLGGGACRHRARG